MRSTFRLAKVILPKLAATYYRPTLSDLLRTAIGQCGMSLRQFSLFSGVSPSAIRGFCESRTTLTLRNAESILRALGLELIDPLVAMRDQLPADINCPDMAELLRRSVRQCGVPPHRIARETGVDEAAICRFLQGKRLLLFDNVDRIAGFVGLSLARRDRN